MGIIFILAAALLTLGAAENFLNGRRVRSIPVRVHVNGTRGKSTTTRLIAAGLRAAGIRTIAKTTGSAAQLILEDGTEVPLKRRGPANIREQLWLVKVAHRRRAEALVVECMALSPETQWVSEHRILHSTIGVLTNVRADHPEEMGPGIDDVAVALSNTIPRSAHLVTAEQRFLPVFRKRACRLKTEVHAVRDNEVSSRDISGFGYPAFGENVACALKACELAGVGREAALKAMWAAAPDPGVTPTYRIQESGKNIYVVNALAANDAESTRHVHEASLSRPDLKGLPVLGVLNGRLDRPQRAAELAGLLGQKGLFTHVFLVGQLGALTSRLLRRNGMDDSAVTDLSGNAGLTPAALLSAVAEEAGGDAVLFAFGNFKGIGLRLVQYCRENGEVIC